MLRSLHLDQINSRIHMYQFTIYTSVFGCGCGFGFKQKFWQIDGFGEKKRHGSADLHTPIHSLVRHGLYPVQIPETKATLVLSHRTHV